MTNIVSITEATLIADKAKRSEMIKGLLKTSTASQKNEAYRTLNGEQRFEEMFISRCETDEIQAVLVEIKYLRKTEKAAEKKAKEDAEKFPEEKKQVEYIIDPYFKLVKKNEIKLAIKLQAEGGKFEPETLIATFSKKPSPGKTIETIDGYINARNVDRVNKGGLEAISYSKNNLHQRVIVAIAELEQEISNFVEVKNITPEVDLREKFSIDVQMKTDEIINKGEEIKHLLQTVAKYHFGEEEIVEFTVYSNISAHFKAPRVIHVAMSGTSSKGKSSLMSKTAFLMPLHTFILYATLSEKHLLYKCKDNPAALKHKTIFIDEVKPDMYDTMKSLTTPDAVQWTYGTVQDGESIDFKPEKPFNVVCASVQIFEEEEMRNRFLFPQSKEDVKPEVLNSLIGASIIDNKFFIENTALTDIDYIISRCFTTKIIEKIQLLSGFTADEYVGGQIIKRTKDGAKNDVSGFIVLCGCIAGLNIFHRKINNKNELIIEQDDFDIPDRIYPDGDNAKLGKLESQILAIFDMPPYMENNVVKTTDELHIYELHSQMRNFYNKNISLQTIRRAVNALTDKGRLETFKKENDKRIYYKVV